MAVVKTHLRTDITDDLLAIAAILDEHGRCERCKGCSDDLRRLSKVAREAAETIESLRVDKHRLRNHE